jgi:DNA polymerase-3 subunit delta
VPKGDRRADKIEQEAVLSERMEVLLNRCKKTMDKEAYRTMYEMTGFDIGTFCDNLEKLISYVGDRKRITAEDVVFVLKRTKKDPIYELTNAIADRDIDKSLFFLNSLLMENSGLNDQSNEKAFGDQGFCRKFSWQFMVS